MAAKIELADLIDRVTDELATAHQRSRTRPREPVLQLSECEIEVAAAVEKDGSGKVSIKVLELSGGLKRTDTSTVRLTFTPTGLMQFEQRSGDADSSPGPVLGRRTAVQGDDPT